MINNIWFQSEAQVLLIKLFNVSKMLIVLLRWIYLHL